MAPAASLYPDVGGHTPRRVPLVVNSASPFPGAHVQVVGRRRLGLASGASRFSCGGGAMSFGISSSPFLLRWSRFPPAGRRRQQQQQPRRGFVVRAKATDLYATLNLSRNASLQEIKTSYRNLARKYHPDMNKSSGAEEKFKEISAAYEVLSDDDKRSVYDRYGEAGLQGEYGGPGVGPQGVDPFEVFDAFFGESNGFFEGGEDSGGISFSMRNNRKQNLDIRYDLSLSFEESVFGGRREIDISRFETCDNCNGTGAKSSSCIKSCMECGGRGRAMKTQRTPFGVVSQVSTCSNCGGDGKIITDHCRSCNGEGRSQKKQNVKIEIPPGVNDGVTMQVHGEGNFDKKRGIAGDLYLFFHVNEKPGVKREGLHLYSDITIDYTEAILGTVVKVETIKGYKELQIPAGTQPGATIRLPNMGVPSMKKPYVRGDHHFTVSVEIPKDISDMERLLVEELASLRASSKDHSLPVNGTIQDKSNTVKCKTRSRKRRDKATKPSFWRSIKNFFGQNQSGSGFAAVSLQVPLPTWTPHSTSDSALVVSMCLVFILCSIFSYIQRRTDPRLLLQQGNSYPNESTSE